MFIRVWVASSMVWKWCCSILDWRTASVIHQHLQSHWPPAHIFSKFVGLRQAFHSSWAQVCQQNCEVFPRTEGHLEGHELQGRERRSRDLHGQIFHALELKLKGTLSLMQLWLCWLLSGYWWLRPLAWLSSFPLLLFSEGVTPLRGLPPSKACKRVPLIS